MNLFFPSQISAKPFISVLKNKYKSGTFNDANHTTDASPRFSGKKQWQSILGGAILSVSTFLMPGCRTDVGNMNREFCEIVNNKKRLDFLSECFEKDNPKIRANVFKLLDNLSISSTKKVNLIVKGIDDQDERVMLAAMKAGQKIANNPDVPQELCETLQNVIDTRPWTESYQEFSHFMMIPMKNSFIYSPIYITKHRQHGEYKKAQALLKEVLQNISQNTLNN